MFRDNGLLPLQFQPPLPLAPCCFPLPLLTRPIVVGKEFRRIEWLVILPAPWRQCGGRHDSRPEIRSFFTPRVKSCVGHPVGQLLTRHLLEHASHCHLEMTGEIEEKAEFRTSL